VGSEIKINTRVRTAAVYRVNFIKYYIIYTIIILYSTSEDNNYDNNDNIGGGGDVDDDDDDDSCTIMKRYNIIAIMYQLSRIIS